VPRSLLAVAAAASLLTAGGASAEAGGLPGARAIRVCAAAGPYWPTMTLALQGSTAWIACKEQSRVTRVDTRTGRTVKAVRLDGPVIAVSTGFGSIWALDSGGTLYRLDASSGKVVRRVLLGVRAAYNIWTGAGSVWVADDQGAEVVRVSPRSYRVIARIAAGDGPADMAFDGGTAWVVNHRDTTVTRIDLATNRSSQLADLDADAPERMVFLRGSLWITGRGTDLLRVDPVEGSVEATIDIGVSGIDVVAAGDSLWIPTRTAEVDQRGFPTMTALKRVSASTRAVSTVVRASGRVDVHGLAAAGGSVWIADNTNGVLYRLP
jgi:hypothetical protein